MERTKNLEETLMGNKSFEKNETSSGLPESLENFQAPFLEEKLLVENIFNSNDKYQEAFLEFKKFAYIAKQNKNIAMTSKSVDHVWHQFILFTRQYMDFCETHIGEYLHHNPSTSFEKVSNLDVKRFISAYESNFGEIPEIWNLQNRTLCGGYACSGGCNCK